RYDPWAALLVTVALLLLAVRRARPAFAFLALAIASKVYAVAALPVAVIRVWRAEGRRRLVQAALTFIAVLVVVVLPFAIVAFGGLGFSFYIQSTRPLQVESLGASILLAADSLGVYDSHMIGGKANSIDLDGALPGLVGAVTSLAVIAAVLAVAWTYIRGSEDRERLVTAFAAAIAGYLVFFKVFSPQYMTWLIPLVPLVAGRRGRTATLLFLGALLLTQVQIYGFDSVHGIPDTHVIYGEPQAWAPWVLLGRNLLLVAVSFVLLAELRAGVVRRPFAIPREPAALGVRPAGQG
ncbi:MAG: hypothetical protein ACXVRA_13040, partial [Gaiellaceae bacterium]